MGDMDSDAILQCIWELTCVTLRESLEPEKVHAINPDEDLQSGEEVLKVISKKNIQPAIWEHCIALFNNISTVIGYMSASCANWSSLAKITNKETFRVISQPAWGHSSNYISHQEFEPTGGQKGRVHKGKGDDTPQTSIAILGWCTNIPLRGRQQPYPFNASSATPETKSLFLQWENSGRGTDPVQGSCKAAI